MPDSTIANAALAVANAAPAVPEQTLTPPVDLSDYWAAKPIEEIASAVEEKFKEYRKWLQLSGYGARMREAYNTFYGFNQDGTIRIVKDKDHVSRMNVNHYKGLLSRLHIMVTESKLDFQPRAKTSDPKSEIEANLAKGICEYYNDEKNMNATTSTAVKTALILLEAYVHCPWDTNTGYELTADAQGPIKTGDQLFENFTAFDVAKNTSLPVSPWRIIRKKVNKYDLAALAPRFATEILADELELDTDGLRAGSGSQTLSGQGALVDDDKDCIWKYILYHDRTAAIPKGRHVEIAAGQVLADGPLKYEKIPCFKLTAGDVIDTVFGDSPAIDLLPLQQAINALYSGTVTNNLNNAKQLIYSADPNLTTRQLSDGQTLVSAAAPPSALNLTGSAAENLKMMDLLKSDQKTLSGVNDVVQGNPSVSVKTSGGQALMIAQAQQFVSQLAQGYAALASDIASCLLSNIQKFAADEMLAYIVGSNKKGMIKTFKKEDVMNIAQVSCDLGNPLTNSLAGRSQLLEQWMQYGVVKDPQQTVTFLATGNVDQVIDDDFNQDEVVNEQLEMLRAGKMPLLLSSDPHPQAIMRAVKLLAQDDVRSNPKLVDLILNQYVIQHLQLMRTMNPDLAAVLSGQPLPPQPPPQQGPQPGQPTQPSVQGVPLPNLPQGVPPQTQQSYQQATQGTPPDPTKGQ